MMAKYFLHDEQIALRAVEPEDLELLYRIENDSTLWDVSATNVPYSRYALRQYIETSLSDIFADRQLRLMVESQSDKRVLGCADLTNFDPLHGRAEVGMALLSAECGQGIGSRVLTLLCDYAFRFLHLHQLYAIVPADNQASLKMFVKCGFHRHLLLKDWLCVDENSETVYRDAVMIQCLSNKRDNYAEKNL